MIDTAPTQYVWEGTQILFNSALRRKRWLQTSNNRQPVPTDIREWFTPHESFILKSIINDQVLSALPRARERTTFDERVRVCWNHIAQYLEYRADPHGPFRDFWQTPSETLALNGGDCEDLSFLLASLILATGVSPFCLRVTFGCLVIDNKCQPHAWVTYKNETGTWCVVESTVNSLPNEWLPADRASQADHEPRYLPRWCCNQYHAWAIDPKVTCWREANVYDRFLAGTNEPLASLTPLC